MDKDTRIQRVLDWLERKETKKKEAEDARQQKMADMLPKIKDLLEVYDICYRCGVPAISDKKFTKVPDGEFGIYGQQYLHIGRSGLCFGAVDIHRPNVVFAADGDRAVTRNGEKIQDITPDHAAKLLEAFPKFEQEFYACVDSIINQDLITFPEFMGKVKSLLEWDDPQIQVDVGFSEKSVSLGLDFHIPSSRQSVKIHIPKLEPGACILPQNVSLVFTDEDEMDARIRALLPEDGIPMEIETSLIPRIKKELARSMGQNLDEEQPLQMSLALKGYASAWEWMFGQNGTET